MGKWKKELNRLIFHSRKTISLVFILPQKPNTSTNSPIRIKATTIDEGKMVERKKRIKCIYKAYYVCTSKNTRINPPRLA